jgi:hypothetical protein
MVQSAQDALHHREQGRTIVQNFLDLLLVAHPCSSFPGDSFQQMATFVALMEEKRLQADH